MKKFLTIVFTLLCISSFAQLRDLSAQRVIATQGFYLRNRWVDTIAVVADTANAELRQRSLPSWSAVYQFATNRINPKEDAANKSTSTALGVSNTLYPSQNAVKVYVDNGLAGRVPTSRTISINGITQDLTADRSWTIAGGGGLGANYYFFGDKVYDSLTYFPASDTTRFGVKSLRVINGSTKLSVNKVITDSTLSYTLDLVPANINHSTLGGLASDDHVQYALLAGRAAGQTLIGGIAAGENLTLRSTAAATKGKVIFGNNHSAFDEVNGRWGFGTTTPGSFVHVQNTTGIASMTFESNGPNGSGYAIFDMKSQVGDVRLNMFAYDASGMNYIQSTNFAGSGNKDIWMTGFNASRGSLIKLFYSTIDLDAPTVKFTNLAGTGSRFAVLDSTGKISRSTTDPSALISGTGSLNKIAYWNSANTLSFSNNLSFDGATLSANVKVFHKSTELDEFTTTTTANATIGAGVVTLSDITVGGTIEITVVGMDYATNDVGVMVYEIPFKKVSNVVTVYGSYQIYINLPAGSTVQTASIAAAPGTGPNAGNIQINITPGSPNTVLWTFNYKLVKSVPLI